MRTRIGSVLIVTLLCAAAAGLVRPPAARALDSRDYAVKERILLLQGYLNSYGAQHGFLYPAKNALRLGGLTVTLWPVNPWTGKPMAPSTHRGDFTYTPSAGRHSYTLVGHLSGGPFTVKGSTPAWLLTERAAQAQALAAARNRETELGVRTIQGYVDAWGMLNNQVAPTSVSALDLGIDPSIWPKNPWNDNPMAVGNNIGDFSYSVGTNGVYVLTAHLSDHDVSLDGTNLTQLRTSMDALRDDLVVANVQNLQAGVDRYAFMNLDALPTGLSKATVTSTYLPVWPKKPWLPYVDVQQGSDFTYTLLDAGCSDQIAGQLSDGSLFTADSTYAGLQHDFRERLKDLSVQLDGELIKEYVEEWKAANGGAAPGIADLSSSGAVGALHGFWPVNQWTNLPMQNADNKGDFQYTPGTGGAYTLTVRQVVAGPFTLYYTPQ